MKRNIALVFLLVALLLLVFVSYLIVKPFLMPIITAGILAIVLYPIHMRIGKLIRKPGPAALVSTLLFLSLTLVPLVGVGVVVTNELTTMYQSLSQKTVEEGGWGRFLDHLLERPLDSISRFLPVSKGDMKAEVVKNLRQASAWGLARLGELIGSVASFFFDALITFLVLFFFLKDGKDLTHGLIESLPLPHRQSEQIFKSISQTVTANVYGVLGVGIIQGALMTIGFLLLGLPSPVMWGIVTAISSMVPLVGTAVVWIPAALYFIIKGAYVKSVIMVAWGGILVGTSDNILRPLLVGTRVKLYPLVIFFSILGGAQAFGLVGLILGPVIATMLIAIANALREVLEG
jgi:predicted PurR-regulated permease PerM